jgi:hypothetical protein
VWHSAKPLLVRLLITAVALGLWFATQSLIGAKMPPASGIGDGMHVLTAPLNQYLRDHPGGANALLIASSAIVDGLALFVLCRWIFADSIRPLLGLILLLGSRQLMQALCSLATPENMIWHDPGVPSLLVTYGVANDYYFSGHTAIAVFAMTELARLQRPWLTRLAIVLIAFEATTVLVLRAHYTMDVFTGLIAALYVADLSAKFAPALDLRLRLLQGHRLKTNVPALTA